MRRISPAENSIPDPVTGKDSWKTPDGITENSIMTTNLLNNWQEEICTLIENAGITLSGTETNQLALAISKNRRIGVNTTLNVGDGLQFETIQAALDSLYGRYIEPNVQVIIQLADQIHYCEDRLFIRLRQGDQVTIKGFSTTDFDLRFISFEDAPISAHQSFVVIEPGCSIKFKDVRLQGDDTSGPGPLHIFKVGRDQRLSLENVQLWYNRGNFVTAEYGGIVDLASISTQDLVTTGLLTDLIFEYGAAFCARSGGVINGSYVTPSATANYSFFAVDGGMINLSDCEFSDQVVAAHRGGIIRAKDVTNFGIEDGTCFEARSGGLLSLLDCVAGDSGGDPGIGYGAYSHGAIEAEGCAARYCSGVGFEAFFGGRMFLDTCAVTNSTKGYQSFEYSYIRPVSCTASVTGATFTPAIGTNDSTLARMG